MPLCRSRLPFVTALVVFSPLALASGEEPPQTLVTISKETTVVTKPLDPDGYVDLLAAINKRLSEGVTPENNAAVPLRIALGLMEARGDQAYRDEYDRMLGIEPAGEGIFVPLVEFARTLGVEDANEAYELLTKAHRRPWNVDENPVIAGWLLANEPALEMITLATGRPKFYTPYIASGDSPLLVAVLLPAVQESRETARALVARATLRAGQGDFSHALDDLEATHRLARLVGQDPTIVGGLVAIAIDSMANHATVAVVSAGGTPAEELAGYLARLDKLPPLPNMSAKIDSFERLMFVDVVTSLARGGVNNEMLNLAGAGAAASLMVRLPEAAKSTMDWDAMLREGHAWYDRLVAALAEETYAGQQAALDVVEADLKSLDSGTTNPLRLAAIFLSDNKTRSRILGKQIGDTLISLLLPAARAASSAENRGKMNFDLTRLSVALEIHRAQTGEYPDALEALAGRVIAHVPIDRFSGEPLQYERQGDGYLLSSVGVNDMLVIRVPVAE